MYKAIKLDLDNHVSIILHSCLSASACINPISSSFYTRAGCVHHVTLPGGNKGHGLGARVMMLCNFNFAGSSKTPNNDPLHLLIARRELRLYRYSQSRAVKCTQCPIFIDRYSQTTLSQPALLVFPDGALPLFDRLPGNLSLPLLSYILPCSHGVPQEGSIEGGLVAIDEKKVSLSDGRWVTDAFLQIQVIILGDSGVGKTSLMNQYVSGLFILYRDILLLGRFAMLIFLL